MKKFVLLFSIFLIKQIKCEIDMDLYRKIPKLNDLENYEECMNDSLNQKSIYCYVDVQIAPQNESTLWDYIDKLSRKRKRYFRHDRLRRGICIQTMNEYLKNNSNTTSSKTFYQPPTYDRPVSPTIFKRIPNSRSDEYQRRYGRKLNEYVNMKELRRYDLKAHSNIMFCDTSHEDTSFDGADKYFTFVVILICVAVIGSSYYDSNIRSQKSQINLQEKISTKESILVSFSFKRNYMQLTKMPLTNELLFINGIRVILANFVIFGHVSMFANNLPTANPEVVEESFQSRKNMIVTNSSLFMQSYITIGGFLLGLHMFYQDHLKQMFKSGLKKNEEEYKRNDALEKKGVSGILINRVFRVLPMTLFVIFFEGTLLYHLGYGPMWKYFTERMRYNCHNFWWTNVLYINNFVHPDEMCAPQTWYLATDFQLHLFYTIVIFVINRYPRFFKHIILSLLIVFLVITSTVIYVNALEPIVVIDLEITRNLNIIDYHIIISYMPAHMNAVSYLLGIFGGWLYFYLKREKIELKNKNWFVVLTWFMYPIGGVILYSCYVFYENDFEKPALWIAIYGALWRSSWGLLTLILIMGYISGIGGVILNFMKKDIFVPLSRLTFCMYLSHLAVLRVMFGNIRDPVILNSTFYLKNFLVLSVIVYLISFLLYLGIEMPFSNLSNVVLSKIYQNRLENIMLMNKTLLNPEKKSHRKNN